DSGVVAGLVGAAQVSRIARAVPRRRAVGGGVAERVVADGDARARRGVDLPPHAAPRGRAVAAADDGGAGSGRRAPAVVVEATGKARELAADALEVAGVPLLGAAVAERRGP